MKTFLAITKALSDETRVRALLSLRAGELCLCQIVDVFKLSPSTVSKHLDLLHAAGLVERRRRGRWRYFRLARSGAAREARRALRWVLGALDGEPQMRKDDRAICCARKKKLEELSACYRAG